MAEPKLNPGAATGRQADAETGRQADAETGRQADAETGRQADAERQTDADSSADAASFLPSPESSGFNGDGTSSSSPSGVATPLPSFQPGAAIRPFRGAAPSLSAFPGAAPAFNDASGVVSSSGLELKTSNATLRIPKGSLERETFIHLFELANEAVRTMEGAGLTEGVDFVASPLVSIVPGSTFLRRPVRLRLRNLFSPYPLDSASARPVLLLNKSGANDRNATDGWEDVDQSRLYTSVTWRCQETSVEIETKILGEFLVLFLFSTPLSIVLNYIRNQVVVVHFSVVVQRRLVKDEEEEEEGTLLTLVVSADPERCVQLAEYRVSQSHAVFGPVPSLFPLCDGFPFQFFLLNSDAAAAAAENDAAGVGEISVAAADAADSINVEKCMTTTGQQRSIFVKDSALPSAGHLTGHAHFSDVLCVTSFHHLPFKRQLPLCEFLEVDDSSLRLDPPTDRRFPQTPSTAPSVRATPIHDLPASKPRSISGAVLRTLAGKRKSVAYLAADVGAGGSRPSRLPLLGMGFRLGPRHLLTHWSIVEELFRRIRSTGGGGGASPSESPTDWETLQSSLQEFVRVIFAEGAGRGKGGKEEREEVLRVSALVLWDLTFTLKWTVLELHGAEKRFPPSLEQHLNPSAVKGDAVFFFGSGGGKGEIEEAALQNLKKSKREEILRKVIELRGHVMSNDDKSLVRNPVVSILRTQGQFSRPGSPGFDPDGKVSMMFLKGFGKFSTATTISAIKESMKTQSSRSETKDNFVKLLLPTFWN